MKLDRTEFLAISGLHDATLEVWLEQSWIVPSDAGPETSFSEIDVARARLIRELQDDMGANDAGIDIILHLMDQLHGMRRAMRELHAQHTTLEKPPGDAGGTARPRRPRR